MRQCAEEAGKEKGGQRAAPFHDSPLPASTNRYTSSALMPPLNARPRSFTPADSN